MPNVDLDTFVFSKTLEQQKCWDLHSIDTQPTNIWHTFTNIQRWEKYASYAAGQIPTRNPLKKHTHRSPTTRSGMLAQSYGHL